MAGLNTSINNFRRSLLVLAYISGALALLTLGWLELSWNSLDLGSIRWVMVGLAMLVQFGSLAVSVLLWNRAVELGCGRRLPAVTALAQVGLGLVAKYIPGKIWGLAVRHQALVAQSHSSSRAASSLAMEQLSSLFTACILSGPAVYMASKRLPGAFVSGLAFVVAIVVILLTSRIRLWLANRMPERLSVSDLAALGVLGLAQWGMSGLAMLLVAAGLGIALDPWSALWVASAVPASVLVGMLAAFAPSGIGVREGTFVLLCSPAIGVSGAVGCALVLRLMATVRDTVVGLLVPVLLGKQGKSNAA